jgi:hypothetical protein
MGVIKYKMTGRFYRNNRVVDILAHHQYSHLAPTSKLVGDSGHFQGK